MKQKTLPIFIFLFLSTVFLVHINHAKAVAFQPQVIDQISNQIGVNFTEIGPKSIGNLIKAIYSYMLGIVGILATLVMMYGGVLYITAAGNASKADNAKQWIFASLTGLLLALSSYTLLYMVNPNLLTMSSIDPETPDNRNFIYCYYCATECLCQSMSDTACNSLMEDDQFSEVAVYTDSTCGGTLGWCLTSSEDERMRACNNITKRECDKPDNFGFDKYWCSDDSTCTDCEQ